MRENWLKSLLKICTPVKRVMPVDVTCLKLCDGCKYAMQTKEI